MGIGKTGVSIRDKSVAQGGDVGGGCAAAAAEDAGHGGGGAQQGVGPRAGRHYVAGESGRGGEKSCCRGDGGGRGEGETVQSGDGGGVGGKDCEKVADGLAREHGSGRAYRCGYYQREAGDVAADDFVDDARVGGRHDGLGEKTVGHSAVKECLDDIGIMVEDVGARRSLRGANRGGYARRTCLAGGLDGGADGVAAYGGA